VLAHAHDTSLGREVSVVIRPSPAKLAARVPLKVVRSIAVAIFVLLGIATLLGLGASMGV
jgi:hypothetical protein